MNLKNKHSNGVLLTTLTERQTFNVSVENLSIQLFGKLDLIVQYFVRMRKEQLASYFTRTLGLVLDAVNNSGQPDRLGLFTEERLKSEPKSALLLT